MEIAVGRRVPSYTDNAGIALENSLEQFHHEVVACLRNTENSPHHKELLLLGIFGSNPMRERIQGNPLGFIQTISEGYPGCQDHIEFMRAFIRTAPSSQPLNTAYSWAIGSKLKSNAHFMGLAIDLYPELMLEADKSLRDCSWFMRERIQKNPSLLSHLGETLSCHSGFILQMITECGASPVDLPRVTTSNPRVMSGLIKGKPNLRFQLDDTLREDERFMLILDHPTAEAG